MSGMLRALLLGLVLACSLALVCASRSAHAAEPAADSRTRVVVLQPIEAEGLLPSDLAALEERVRTVFEHPQIRLVRPSKAPTCGDQPCLLELGREHHASHVVRTTVVAEGRDYLAQIDVLVVGEDQQVDTIDASCRICGLAEFDDRLAARAVSARDWVLATPMVGRLRVDGRPQQARIRIDGRWRGQLPFAGELGVGSHDLVVSAGGYFREVRPVETLAGVEQRLELELAPKPVLEWHRSVGWATLGAGLGSLTTSAILFGVHGQPATLQCDGDTGDPGDPSQLDGAGDCRWIRRTSGVGIGLAVVGVASTIVGASLLVVDSRRRRANERGAGPEIRAALSLDRVELQVRF
ncbi:MAG: PEGA domain-containing protein [Enhygromyxa sp.]